MNDCSDLTYIRLRKFSISVCCSTVILISLGTIIMTTQYPPTLPVLKHVRLCDVAPDC